MLKIPKHIEIVSSTEAGLSSMGHVSREAIRLVLEKRYDSVVVTIVNNLDDLEALVSRRPDLVFLGMKFIPVNQAIGRNDPDKIWIADYLEEHDILYTGSDGRAHELELNKELAKQQVKSAGLKTSTFSVVKQGRVFDISETDLRYPMFVKPANRGGGQGIDTDSLVHTFDQLETKVMSLSRELQADSLVENYLPGREFSISVLKDTYDEGYSIMPIELVSEDTVLSAAIKAANTEVVSLVGDVKLQDELCTLAMDVFEALGARDYGRIDVRLDENGAPHFLEANLLPSLIDGYGSFPKACVLGMNLEYEQMIQAIVSLAFTRMTDDAEEILPVGLLPMATVTTALA